ncbi:MAG: hypothetical protein ACXWZY_10815 [Gaiellaceae bacterium]
MRRVECQRPDSDRVHRHAQFLRDELDRVEALVRDQRVELELTTDLLDVAEVRFTVRDENVLELERDQLRAGQPRALGE